MVKVSEAVIARYEHSGEKFEVLVDPNLAMELKKGNQVNFDELLAIDSVFKDSAKGQEASPESINKVFHTTEIKEVARQIILHGRVQLTTEQKREMTEQRRKEIIDFIAKNAMNPQTSSPHPPQRIENALQEARITVDPMKSVSEQVPEIIKEIRKLIPISFEKLKIAVKIPAQYAGKANFVLHKYEVKQEEWLKDGSLAVVVEVPAGMKAELFNELNHLTHGQIESKILER
ncbi:MAG: ribosome assembly factor SBDS [Candidatus Diapherotrites archaeon]